MRRNCPRCQPGILSGENCPGVQRSGHFYRKSDGRWVARLKCLACGLRFSHATFHPCFRQKKRHLNYQILKEFASGVSERRMARKLCVSRKTIARKLLFLGARARVKLKQLNEQMAPVAQFEFDDMETFEHTKCKPLSISLAVQTRKRRVLAFEVSRMAANGRLAQKSLRKYGKRIDERASARERLFTTLKPIVHSKAVIKSDQNPHYPEDVKRFFPEATHLAFKGRKPAATGQGELKEGGFDPLFSLNHTAAMFRYGIATLIRKTWCTTKKAERLADRIAIYCQYHNFELI